ncbi:MAG: hypothetical protein WBP13_12385 [Methylophilaceae bacterium]
MINRRSFLLSLAVQPLVLNNIMGQLSNNPSVANLTYSDPSEFVIVGGWVLLKSDFLSTEG